MGFILLIVFQFSSASIYIDTQEECIALARLNQAYWASTGQIVRAVCMKSFEV